MDSDREHACPPPPMPEALSVACAGYAWARDTVGQSGGAVFRLHGKPGAPDLFVKHGRGALADDIVDEMVRLRWLAGHVSVPVVTRFTSTPDEAWLVMTAMPGETAYQALAASPDAGPAVVDALADFLRRVHAVPASDCPFISDAACRLTRGRERIDAGLVDEDDFEEVRRGWTAERVWDALQRQLPLTSDSVVTHGDFSLDNILMLDGAVIGCIDVGRVGIADRYQDLAILWNCLGEFGTHLQDRLFARYGIADIDHRKMEFHLLLDELF